MSDPMFKMVAGQRVEMTASEVEKLLADQALAQSAQPTEPAPEPEPIYKELTEVEYMTLVMAAGGLTPEQFVEIMETSTNAQVKMLRILLDRTRGLISRDMPIVAQGLGILQGTDPAYLTEEDVAAIMGAWPQV